jgi:hypothetical protein
VLLYTSAAILVFGVALLVLGMRGRRVGEDPHCRTCGFNLRGRDPDSERCPECGTEVTAASLAVGRQQRWPALIRLGLGLALLGAAASGVQTWRWAHDADWSKWKPTAWLISDLETVGPRERGRALDELLSRVRGDDAKQADVDAVVDHMLTLQADRSKAWKPDFGRLVEVAARAGHVDRPRRERYLRQSVSVQLQSKPKARRGKEFAFAVRGLVDRSYDGGVGGTWQMAPLAIGGTTVEVFRPREPSRFVRNFENNASVHGFQWRGLNIPDGRHEIATSVTVELKIPGIDGSAKVELPVSTVVEVVPGDAIVDTFQAEPSMRAQMSSRAFGVALVNCDRLNSKTRVLCLRLRSLAVLAPLAVDVFVVQQDVEYKLPNIVHDVDSRNRWTSLSTFVDGDITGTVDVHLRPSQDAADRIPRVRTYWGEPIILRNLTVNASYAAPFTNDESIRPAVEKSLSVKIQRIGTAPNQLLRVQWRADAPPHWLAYRVELATRDRAHVLERCWIAERRDVTSAALTCEDIDPKHQAAECDLILMPADNWEAERDLTSIAPPWGGQVIFRNVKIEPPATSP